MSVLSNTVQAERAGETRSSHEPAIRVSHVYRRFGRTQALDDVSLEVGPGAVHAILGPNGAGKTTLLRILVGLVRQDEGEVRLFDIPTSDPPTRAFREMFALVPSGDRTFYLRLSGVENLLFFGRLYGMSRRQALHRAWECLEAVDLRAVARRPVNTYSHGMQKRLSIARALLRAPPILFFDEATHDLDPAGATRIRELVRDTADTGTSVLWATQRLEEIRGFCDRVTLLHKGRVRFAGTVPDLMTRGLSHRYLLQMSNGQVEPGGVLHRAEAALTTMGTISPLTDSEGQYLVSLREGIVLGDAISALAQAGMQVVACRQERSEIEDAFLSLIDDGPG